MLYYRVKTPDKLFRFNGYMQTIGNELFTPAEYRKYSTPDKRGCYLRREWLEAVNVSKKRVYWCFSARFEMR